MYSLKFALFLIIPALLLTVNCTNQTQSKSNDEKEVSKTVPVEATEAVRGDISALYGSTATLEAREDSDVLAKVGGIVKEIHAEEGDFVKAGQVLARLEDEQLEIEEQRSRSTLEKTQNEYQRSKELFERKLISAEEFDNIRFEFENQKATYELAKLNLENTAIKSPISGTVSSRLIKKGNLVQTNDILFHITDTKELQAILYIPEHEIAKIRPGQKAVLKPDAVKNQTVEGTVERVSPVVDAESGTVKTTISITNNNGDLKPGMFTRVQIIYDTRSNTVLIPKNAVIENSNGQMVYIIKDSIAIGKKIRTGYVNGSKIEVLEGLTGGEFIITAGFNSVNDSSLVQIITASI